VAVLLGVVSEVVGGTETEGRDSAEAEGRGQQGECGNGDNEGRAKKPTEEHLLFSAVWGDVGWEGKRRVLVGVGLILPGTPDLVLV
jgi:hypothetical protein